MTKKQLRALCGGFKMYDILEVEKKPLYMSKYGRSSKFVPRIVSYKPFVMMYCGISDNGEYLRGRLVGGDEVSLYFSKILSIKNTCEQYGCNGRHTSGSQQ